MLAIRPRSSLIDRVVYDEDGETLTVTLHNRRRFIYSDVPRAVYEALKKAGSAGRFFNGAVKGRFPCHTDRRRYPLP